jgi:hypothetical protein
VTDDEAAVGRGEALQLRVTAIYERDAIATKTGRGGDQSIRLCDDSRLVPEYVKAAPYSTDQIASCVDRESSGVPPLANKLSPLMIRPAIPNFC